MRRGQKLQEYFVKNRPPFPSLKRRGGCALTKRREATEMAQPGWSVRRNVSECIFKTFAELTTPAASLRKGTFVDVAATPPFQGGEKAQRPFLIVKNGQSPVPSLKR